MIREATIDDLKPLAALYKEFMIYNNNFDPEMFKIPDDKAALEKITDTLNESVCKVICHETDGIIDGYVRFLVISVNATAEKPDGLLMVYDVFVTEKSRRKGVGTALLKELDSIAAEKYCNIIQLDVHQKNSGAKAFYEKCGLIPQSIKLEKRI